MDVLTLGITAILVQISDSYVLIPSRKQQDNISSIDAHSNKSVPSRRYAGFGQEMARDPEYDERHEREDYPNNNAYISKFNKNYAVNNLTNKDSARNYGKIGAILIKFMDNFTKKLNGGAFRTNAKEIKAKSIQFRTGKSSVLYEIDSEMVINAIKDLLASNGLRRFVKSIIKQSDLDDSKEVPITA